MANGGHPRLQRKSADAPGVCCSVVALLNLSLFEGDTGLRALLLLLMMVLLCYAEIPSRLLNALLS